MSPELKGSTRIIEAAGHQVMLDEDGLPISETILTDKTGRIRDVAAR